VAFQGHPQDAPGRRVRAYRAAGHGSGRRAGSLRRFYSWCLAIWTPAQSSGCGARLSAGAGRLMARRTAVLGLYLASLIALLTLPAASQHTRTLPLGSFQWEITTNGILVTAPHGTFDRNTDAIAVQAAARLKAGYVVARGFHAGARINVNRPTEGSGLPCGQERATERAREVYLEYERLVLLASGGAPLRVYAEVHGNSRAETSGQVEIATKGVSEKEAAEVKTAYAGILSMVRTQWPSYPVLHLLIEPVDRLYWTASCAKRIGTMAQESIARALHFEFPAAAREATMVPASAMLVATIVEQVVR
jgi:hypothetical protein